MTNKYTRIIGTGSVLPDFVLTNDMLEKMVDTSDEWIVSRTGIKERRIELEREVSELGVIAAQRALECSGERAEDMDFVILSTVTPEFYTPSTANVIQGKLNIPNAFSFDVSAACSGFIYALDIADLYIKSGKAKKGLIVSCDMVSRITDYEDRTMSVLMGDAAGAVVVTGDTERGIQTSYIRAASNDNRYTELYANSGITKALFDKQSGEYLGRSAPNRDAMMHMNGRAIYEFIVKILPVIFEKCLGAIGKTSSDIDHMLIHQANKRIIDYLIEKYGLNTDRVPMNIERYGNTSSSTTPLLLDELNRNGKLKEGDLVALIAFGAGLTYGASILRW